MIYAIGFLAQTFFSARILFQWILSERAQKVLSPAIFWILSILGSYLLFIYGWLREDFSILLGQFASYYIYLWNLKEKGLWKRLFLFLKAILLLTPMVAICFVLRDTTAFFENFLQNEDVPLWLLLFGSLGQIIFTMRFIYQWFYSHKREESLLPIGFWIISLVGSGAIVAYALFRADPVLILGQSVGFIAYSRNIAIARKERKMYPHEN